MTFIPPKLVVNPVVARLLELGVQKAEIALRTGKSWNNVHNWSLGAYSPKDKETKQILNNMLALHETNREKVLQINDLQKQIENIALKN